MEDGLNPVVQKMIDAGESEENIATVIQHYKQQPSSATVTLPPGQSVMGMGRRSAATSGMSEQAFTDSQQGTLEKVNGALRPIAHPTEPGDATQMLMAIGGAPQMIGQALAPVAKYGAAAAKLAGSAATALMPTAAIAPARAALKVLGELKPSEWNNPLTVAGREGRATAAVARDVMPYKPNIGGVPASSAPTSTARVAYPAPEPPVAASAAPATSAPSSVEDLLRERGLDPSRAVSSAPAPAGAKPTAFSGVKPSPVESPLQQPRVQTGAEQVGREQGLSKQQVRDQTAPILGEAQGDASPILPEKALGRIVDTLKSLPPGSPEREAYVARATSGKSQWQIENIRRTLEHLGLIAPIAPFGAAAIRQIMLGQLGSDQHEQR